MTTYLELKNRVLKFCDAVGSTDADDIVELALEEAMRFIAQRITVPPLIAEATHTVTSTDLSNSSVALHASSPDGFAITQSLMSSPNRLFIKKDSSTAGKGQPYTYQDYLAWLDLKSVPSYSYPAIFTDSYTDERPARSYTIDLSRSLIAEPMSEGNVMTLFYNKPPAVYSDAGTPELEPMYEHVLVNGAVLILKEWIREPDVPLDPNTILQPLISQIREIDIHRRSNRQRESLKPSNRYRIY